MSDLERLVKLMLWERYVGLGLVGAIVLAVGLTVGWFRLLDWRDDRRKRHGR